MHFICCVMFGLILSTLQMAASLHSFATSWMSAWWSFARSCIPLRDWRLGHRKQLQKCWLFQLCLSQHLLQIFQAHNLVQPTAWISVWTWWQRHPTPRLVSFFSHDGICADTLASMTRFQEWQRLFILDNIKLIKNNVDTLHLSNDFTIEVHW